MNIDYKVSVQTLVTDAIGRSIQAPNQGNEYFTRPAGSYLTGNAYPESSDSEIQGALQIIYPQGIEVPMDDGARITGMLLGLPWVEVTDEARALGVAFGECRYFKAPVPRGMKGHEDILLGEDLTDEQLAQVRLVRHHGTIQMQLPGDTDSYTETDVIHIILGHMDDYEVTRSEYGTAIVGAWHPGRLTECIDLKKATVKIVKP